MKQLFYLFISLMLLASCKSNTSALNHSANNTTEKEEPLSYFPVTDYIKGQIADIRLDAVNPIKYTIQGAKKDSSWLKADEFEKAFADFLTPAIDSANMIALFSEKKFLDQSVNAFTFTYDAKASLPDSMHLYHWDVYVEPKTGKVARIFLQKKLSADKQQQLTWVNDESAKIVTIQTRPDGSFDITGEQEIKWKF